MTKFQKQHPDTGNRECKTIKKQLIAMIKTMPEEKAWELLNTLSNDPVERRAHERQKCAISTEFQTHDRMQKGLINDICAGGVFIETRENIGIGNEITLAFIPKNNREAVKITGTVVRNTPGGIGVKFFEHIPDLISEIIA